MLMDGSKWKEERTKDEKQKERKEEKKEIMKWKEKKNERREGHKMVKVRQGR